MSDANFRKGLDNYDAKLRAYTEGVGAIRQDLINFEHELSEALIKLNHALLALAAAVECEARAATDQRLQLFDLANDAVTFDDGSVRTLVACAEARKAAVDTAKKRAEDAQKELTDLIGRQRTDLLKGSESLNKICDQRAKK